MNGLVTMGMFCGNNSIIEVPQQQHFGFAGGGFTEQFPKLHILKVEDDEINIDIKVKLISEEPQ